MFCCVLMANSSRSTNVVSSPDEASLRAAIQIGGWVSLNFNGTITLTNTIVITNNVILDGSGVSAIISGGNAVRLFYVSPGASFSATNLNLVNGYVSADSAEGGAIFNDGGTVSLVSCTVTNNSVASLGPNVKVGSGGAIFTQNGALFLLNSSFSGNRVTNTDSYTLPSQLPGRLCGGALYNNGSLVKIVACNFSGNSCYGGDGGWMALGGAVYQAAGSLLATNSILAFNRVTGGGDIWGSPHPGPGLGGAFYAAGGIVAIDHCQFLTNAAIGRDPISYFTAAGFGGAIYSAATMTAESSTSPAIRRSRATVLVMNRQTDKVGRYTTRVLPFLIGAPSISILFPAQHQTQAHLPVICQPTAEMDWAAEFLIIHCFWPLTAPSHEFRCSWLQSIRW